ncbi:MAG: pyruvate, phosphate dikinase [Bacilli bacterium]|nr:pyruvate, phosphate dikinase [Bacilli bacterium]
MKYVYAFSEGNKDMREILGGKGANLAEMTFIGLPVPRGFTVATNACSKYYEDNKVLNDEIINQIYEKLEELEGITGKKLGDVANPLLVSVRSGARASMPGMMDTILNLGMNDLVCDAIAKQTNNERFAFDSYRRFIQMFADVVMNFPKEDFEELFDKIKEEKGIKEDTDLTAQDLAEIIIMYKEKYKLHAGVDFPQDPKFQLIEAVKAVFRSWNTERAITYRRLNDIPDSWGTAVNVQEMVYGNKGDTSGTGVAFTRNPSTGEKKLFGEYLMNAQGEDVVAGIRTPKSIETLKEIMPEVYDEFNKICNILENHYKDMQDMEFTIEDGKLFMLQTRNGKRTAEAAIKIAVDLVEEGVITKEEALLKVEANSLDQLLHPTFEEDCENNAKIIAKGLAASPGAASGHIYFSASDVIDAHKNGVNKIILVRKETSPEDIEGMNTAEGILTIHGGMTSHAAVVARGMGKCCVSGCSDLVIDEAKKTITTKDGTIYNEGDFISLNGSLGHVYEGEITTVEPKISGYFETFMKWADEVRTLGVRVNADTPVDAETAKNFGAEGIGLCRTEHMFFEENRIFNFRKMIVATTKEERELALSEILPYQREDFYKLMKTMAGYEVTIRFLDPPLHEFLPKTNKEINELAHALKISFEELKTRIESLKEFNPMMGHRGCRLAVTYPEIAVMQTKAVIEAGIMLEKENTIVEPEIMIPLIGDINELKYVKEIIKSTADSVIKESNSNLKYKIGTMIEIPRACLIAEKIAEEAEFFSFGTNDLTQLTYGFSRDDASKYLNDYYDKKIFENDPFKTIDEEGIGSLVDMGVTLGKKVRPNISLGICGEHGGDPKTIDFCHRVGLTYVSCSPYRIPVARLAAAQAAITNQE